MPKEWPAAALQAQAVAARSYALASIVKNRDFDLYADPRSQMYYGVAAESPATTAAVKATKGEILTYGGKVATTFYYSSSGGRTASSEDVFGLVLPYLQSRPDPWDAGSPYHRWEPRSFTAASLAAAFGLSAPVVDVVVVPTVSGRPASVTLSRRPARRSSSRRQTCGRDWVSARPRSSSACSASPARPRPRRPAGPWSCPGSRATSRRRCSRSSRANGAWVPSVKVAPDDDGSFAVTVRPKATATYRLTADGQAGPALTITVPAGPAK